MGKIKRKDRGAEPAPAGVSDLVTCSIEELPDRLHSFDRKLIEKGDLGSYADLLDRFDDILADIIKTQPSLRLDVDYFTSSASSSASSPPPLPSRLIREILAFTSRLMEHCRNKHMYASMDHIQALLSSSDPEIIYSCLDLLHTIALRNTTRASTFLDAFVSKKIMILALAGSRTHNTPFTASGCLSTLTPTKDDVLKLEVFHDSYADLSSSSHVAKHQQQAQSQQQQQKQAEEMLGEAEKRGSAKQLKVTIPSLASATGPIISADSVHAPIPISDFCADPHQGFQLYSQMVTQYGVPLTQRFSFWTRVRFARAAYGADGIDAVHAWAKLRMIAIAIMSYCSPSQSLPGIIHFNPDLISQIEMLLRTSQSIPVPLPLQSCALWVLTSLQSDRQRQSSIITATGFSNYHGTLPTLLRSCAKDLMASHRAQLTENDLMRADAAFTFLMAVVYTSAACNAAIASGSLQPLLSLLKDGLQPLPSSSSSSSAANPNFQSVLESIFCRCFTTLDTLASKAANSQIVRTFFESHASEIAADILNFLMSEVNKCKEWQSSAAATASASSSGSARPLAPNLRKRAIEKALRTLSSLVLGAGATVRTRELLESEAPLTQSLLHILPNPLVYGTSISERATAILTAFIHNEPQNLSVVLAHGLVDCVLSNFEHLPISNSAEYILALIQAVGAFCLTEAGVSVVKKHDIFPRLFAYIQDPALLTTNLYVSANATSLANPAQQVMYAIGSELSELYRQCHSIRSRMIEVVMEHMQTAANACLEMLLAGKCPDMQHVHALSNMGKMMEGVISPEGNPDFADKFIKAGGLQFVSRICSFAFPSTSAAAAVAEQPTPSLIGNASVTGNNPLFGMLKHLCPSSPTQVIRTYVETVGGYLQAMSSDTICAEIKDEDKPLSYMTCVSLANCGTAVTVLAALIGAERSMALSEWDKINASQVIRPLVLLENLVRWRFAGIEVKEAARKRQEAANAVAAISNPTAVVDASASASSASSAVPVVASSSWASVARGASAKGKEAESVPMEQDSSSSSSATSALPPVVEDMRRYVNGMRLLYESLSKATWTSLRRRDETYGGMMGTPSTSAKAVSVDLCTALCALISPRIEQDATTSSSSACLEQRSEYYNSVFTLLTSVLFDDRRHKGANTLNLLNFRNSNGLTKVVATLSNLIPLLLQRLTDALKQEKEQPLTSKAEEESAANAAALAALTGKKPPKDTKPPLASSFIHQTLLVMTRFIQRMATSSLIESSAMTSGLQVEHSRTVLEALTLETRSSAARCILSLFNSESSSSSSKQEAVEVSLLLSQCPDDIAVQLLSTIAQLKSKQDVSVSLPTAPQQAPQRGAARIPGMMMPNENNPFAAPPRVVAAPRPINPEHVAMLTGMGFTVPQAEEALRRTNGNVNRAVDLCLSDPSLAFFTASSSSASASASSSAAAPAAPAPAAPAPAVVAPAENQQQAEAPAPAVPSAESNQQEPMSDVPAAAAPAAAAPAAPEAPVIPADISDIMMGDDMDDDELAMAIAMSLNQSSTGEDLAASASASASASAPAAAAPVAAPAVPPTPATPAVVAAGGSMPVSMDVDEMARALAASLSSVLPQFASTPSSGSSAGQPLSMSALQGSSGSSTADQEQKDLAQKKEELTALYHELDKHLIRWCIAMLSRKSTLIYPCTDILSIYCKRKNGEQREQVISALASSALAQSSDKHDPSTRNCLCALSLLCKNDTQTRSTVAQDHRIVPSILSMLYSVSESIQSASSLSSSLADNELWETIAAGYALLDAFTSVPPSWIGTSSASAPLSLKDSILSALAGTEDGSSSSSSAAAAAGAGTSIQDEVAGLLSQKDVPRVLDVCLALLRALASLPCTPTPSSADQPQLKPVPQSALLAVLRMLSKLTRSFDNAMTALDQGCAELLMRIGGSYPSCASHIHRILRHMIEDTPTLQAAMESEIQKVLTTYEATAQRNTVARGLPPPTTADMPLRSLLRDLQVVMQRDVVTFFKALPRVATFKDKATSGPSAATSPREVVVNLKKDTAKRQTTPASKSIVRIVNALANALMTEPTPPSVVLPSDFKGKGKASSSTVSANLSDVSPSPMALESGGGGLPHDFFMRFDADDSVLSPQLLPSFAASSPSLPGGSSSAAVEPSPKPGVLTTIIPALVKPLSRSQILQLLGDLVVSYHHVGNALLKFSHPHLLPAPKPHHHTPAHPTAAAASSYGLVRALVREFLPYTRSPARKPEWARDEFVSQKMAESSCTNFLLSSLFARHSGRVASEFVSALTEETSISRPPMPLVHAIADTIFSLIQHVANAQQRRGGGGRSSSGTSDHVARALVDQGTVAALVRCLDSMDLDHPDATEVVNSLLRPLEILVRVAAAHPKPAPSATAASALSITPKKTAAAAAAAAVVPPPTPVITAPVSAPAALTIPSSPIPVESSAAPVSAPSAPSSAPAATGPSSAERRTASAAARRRRSRLSAEPLSATANSNRAASVPAPESENMEVDLSAYVRPNMGTTSHPHPEDEHEEDEDEDDEEDIEGLIEGDDDDDDEHGMDLMEGFEEGDEDEDEDDDHTDEEGDLHDNDHALFAADDESEGNLSDESDDEIAAAEAQRIEEEDPHTEEIEDEDDNDMEGGDEEEGEEDDEGNEIFDEDDDQEGGGDDDDDDDDDSDDHPPMRHNPPAAPAPAAGAENGIELGEDDEDDDEEEEEEEMDQNLFDNAEGFAFDDGDMAPMPFPGGIPPPRAGPAGAERQEFYRHLMQHGEVADHPMERAHLARLAGMPGLRDEGHGRYTISLDQVLGGGAGGGRSQELLDLLFSRNVGLGGGAGGGAGGGLRGIFEEMGYAVPASYSSAARSGAAAASSSSSSVASTSQPTGMEPPSGYETVSLGLGDVSAAPSAPGAPGASTSSSSSAYISSLSRRMQEYEEALQPGTYSAVLPATSASASAAAPLANGAQRWMEDTSLSTLPSSLLSQLEQVTSEFARQQIAVVAEQEKAKKVVAEQAEKEKKRMEQEQEAQAAAEAEKAKLESESMAVDQAAAAAASVVQGKKEENEQVQAEHAQASPPSPVESEIAQKEVAQPAPPVAAVEAPIVLEQPASPMAVELPAVPSFSSSSSDEKKEDEAEVPRPVEVVPVVEPKVEQVAESSPDASNAAAVSQSEQQQQSQEKEAEVDESSIALDLDEETLAALPEDIRAEVLAAQQAARRASSAASATSASSAVPVAGNANANANAIPEGIDPEFLAALPPEMQAELIQQEQARQRAASASSNNNANAEAAVDMDTASFIASLSPDLREDVLLTSDPSVLRTLPPALQQEAIMLRERYARQQSRAQLHASMAPGGARRAPAGGSSTAADFSPSAGDSDDDGAAAAASSSAAALKKGSEAESDEKQQQQSEQLPILDSEGVRALMRVVSMIQPIQKQPLQRTLYYASSANVVTSTEIVDGLLRILSAMRTLPNSSSSSSSSSSSAAAAGVAALSSSAIAGSSPLPLASLRRALDCLVYLTRMENTRSASSILVTLPSTPASSVVVEEEEEEDKKGKGKQPEGSAAPTTTTTAAAPPRLSAVISLLQSEELLKRSEMLQQILYIVSACVDVVSHLSRKKVHPNIPAGVAKLFSLEDIRCLASPLIRDECDEASASYIQSIFEVIVQGEETRREEVVIEVLPVVAAAAAPVIPENVSHPPLESTPIVAEASVSASASAAVAAAAPPPPPPPPPPSSSSSDSSIIIDESSKPIPAAITLTATTPTTKVVKRLVRSNTALAKGLVSEIARLAIQQAKVVADSLLRSCSSSTSSSSSSSSAAASAQQDEAKLHRLINSYYDLSSLMRITPSSNPAKQAASEGVDEVIVDPKLPSEGDYVEELGSQIGFLWDAVEAFMQSVASPSSGAKKATATKSSEDVEMAAPAASASASASASGGQEEQVMDEHEQAEQQEEQQQEEEEEKQPWSALSARILPLLETFFIFHSSSATPSSFTADQIKQLREDKKRRLTRFLEQNREAINTVLRESAAPPAKVDHLLDTIMTSYSMSSAPVAVAVAAAASASASASTSPIITSEASELNTLPAAAATARSVLDFDNKRRWLKTRLREMRGQAQDDDEDDDEDEYAHQRGDGFRMSVRRSHVFEDSFFKLRVASPQELRGRHFSVTFEGEPAIDAGGVVREWFAILSRDIFNPNYALFERSSDRKYTYQPNPASGVNVEHLDYFQFVGRVIGLAIFHHQLLDAHFTVPMYKHMSGIPVTYHDIEAVDPEYYKNLKWMIENDITDVLDLTFTAEADVFGVKKMTDLKPNGSTIPVTQENKMEYVRLVTELKMTTAVRSQINNFLKGLHSVVPQRLLCAFTESELELLICGLPEIDVDDLRANTEYLSGYTSTSPQIQWFWRAVYSFSAEERAKLLQFVTGTSKVPLEGFRALSSAQGVQRFNVHRINAPQNHLPTAHTCFNQIDIPPYDSYEKLRERLLTAISEGSEGFGLV